MERNSSENKLATLFDDLQKGLIQALDYANGEGSARVYTVNIDLMTDNDKNQAREILIRSEPE
jgi:hypothetical protein